MPGPVLPSAAVRGNEGYGGDNKMSPKSLPKDLVRSPGRQVPRYRSAMMEGSPRSQKSGKSGKSPEKAKQTRRQRTAMLMADGTPKKQMEHSRTAMLMASKSVAVESQSQDGTQSTGSLVSFVQGKVKGLVESVRHRNWEVFRTYRDIQRFGILLRIQIWKCRVDTVWPNQKTMKKNHIFASKSVYMVDRSQKSSSCTLCAVVKLHGCLHRVVICELTFAFDLVQSNDCARCRGLGVRDASCCVHCTLKKPGFFCREIGNNFSRLPIQLPWKLNISHFFHGPRWCPFVFSNLQWLAATLLPRPNGQDALEFRHLVSTFQARLRANGPNSTLQPGGCVAAVPTVTVAAVAARGNVSLQTPTWKRLTAKQRWSKTSRWVMHQSFGTFGSEKLMQCQRFVDVDFIAFSACVSQRFGTWEFWDVESLRVFRQNLGNWPKFFPRLFLGFPFHEQLEFFFGRLF